MLAAAACALSLVLAVAYAPPARPQEVTGNVNDLITGGMPNITSVEIAPMASPGEQVPGTWTTVPNDAFSGMLARTGIIPGVSDPSTMVGRPGQVDFIPTSDVVNPGGTRVTIGYFVKTKGIVRDFAVENDVFVLMSYDYVLKDGVASVAFEVFIFQLPGSTLYNAQADGLAPLQYGVAVNGDGNTLSYVPLNIAQVGNYKGNKVPENTLVRPGVGTAGVGCFECHSRDDEFTGRTGGFPWRSKVLEVTVPPPPAVTTPAPANCPPESPGPARPAPGGTSDEHGSAGARPMLGGVLCGTGVRTPGPARPGKDDDEDDRDERDGDR